jgi:glycosyltransferase involved in cell wall biosynthesis
MNKLSLDVIKKNFPLTKYIDIGLAKSATDVNSLSLYKGFKLLFLVLKVWWVTLFFKPHKVYATISPTGASFIKDCIFLFTAKLLRIPIFFHIHGNGMTSYYNKRFYRLFYNFLFKNEVLIVLSPTLRNEYSILEVPCKFEVVPNFNLFNVPVLDSSKVVNEESENLLFFSNLRKGKGLFDFYNSVKKLLVERKSLQVTIAGPWSSEKDKEELLGMIELDSSELKLDLSKKISFAGPIYSDVEKLTLFQTADVFVFPSLIDTFPLVVLEAMEIGVPVISTNQGAIPDMLSGGAGVVVEKGDIDSIQRNILQLLNNKEMSKNLVSTAKKKVKEQYSKEYFETSLIRVLKEEL